MALDGIFLKHLIKEISNTVINTRVEKIYQPNKEEIIIAFRGKGIAKKLLLSARANSARINFTNYPVENPMTPPMLCMLLRKKLCGGKLVSITQPGLERLVVLEFEAINELGDYEQLFLNVEIMGKYSNIILTDSKNIIIDSLKRVDMTMSSKRLVLPNLEYSLPPKQNKLNILERTNEEIFSAIISLNAEKPLNKSLLEVLQGVSPIVCREMEYLISSGRGVTNFEIDERTKEKLFYYFDKLRDKSENISGKPYVVYKADKSPIDVSFIETIQYGTSVEIKECNSFSEALDDFYYIRDNNERMNARAQDLLKSITNIIERLSRKINIQKSELKECEDREKYRIWGDLLQGNLYRAVKGQSFIDVENYYSENNEIVRIKLDPTLTPTQNLQKLYKEYNKLKNAEKYLSEQISKAETELVYMDSVFESLTRAENEADLSEIRNELSDGGYIRKRKSKVKDAKVLPPREFISSEGFLIKVGRNNRQNDKLTLKESKNYDMWFHTKNIPGSHTVVVTNGKEPGENTILEAAELAAYFSKAYKSSQVPVDYTIIKNVSKPQGSKPGMVIYVKNKTVYVTPKLIDED